MSDLHSEALCIYDLVNSSPETSVLITSEHRNKELLDEVIRWMRKKLGDCDLNLIPRERRGKGAYPELRKRRIPAFPKSGPGKTWRMFIHDCAHYTHQMLYGDNEPRHGVEHVRLELELTELVVGWFKDEAKDIRRSFSRLNLSPATSS